MAGERGREEKQRWGGTGTPEGWLGERGAPTLGQPPMVQGSAGKERDLRRGTWKGYMTRVSSTCSGPREPAGVQSLNLYPSRPR